MHYSITLSYDGTSLSGWQIQPSASSVQEILQHALSTILREEISVTGAGRTDAKVSAIRYVAHFDAVGTFDTTKVVCKLNAILPSSILVHGIQEAPEDFHARFSATQRGYMYFINRRRDPFIEKYSLRYTFPLDVEKMNRAAAHLLGTRDFSCFEKVGGSSKTPICTVTEARFTAYTPTHVSLMGYPCEEGDYLVFTIRANRFLRNMVRAIVGTLLEIGRGRREEEWIDEVLSSGNRSSAGESVPGHPLFLMDVKY